MHIKLLFQIVIQLLLLFLSACTAISTPSSNNADILDAPGELLSPDFQKVAILELITSNADPTLYLTLNLVIEDSQTGERLFETNTAASERMFWSFERLGNSAVKLSSSDIGNYCWKEKDNSEWLPLDCPP